MANNQEKEGEFSGFEPVEERPSKPSKPVGGVKRPIAPAKISIGQRKVAERVPAKSDQHARRMANFVLFETIFLVIILGVCVYLFYVSYNMREDLAKQKGELINDNRQIKSLTASLKQADNDLTGKRNELTRLKSDYKILSNDWNQSEKERDALKFQKEELENELNLSQAEKEENDIKLRETAEQAAYFKNLAEKLEDEKKKLGDKLAKVETEYDKLWDREQKTKLIRESMHTEIEEQYVTYAPAAVKIIDKLREVHSGVKAGLDFKQFVQLTEDNLDIAFEEFKIKIKEKHQKFLSFKFITEAFSAYKETVERWRSLARSPLPEDIGSFRNNIIKFEQPVEQYRPWVDTIQMLWQKASLFTNVASIIIEAKESFDFNTCLSCNGKHVIICPKCVGSGECVYCGGKGFLDEPGNPVCPSCLGSKKCPTCLGKKEISCPVCTFALEKASEK